MTYTLTLCLGMFLGLCGQYQLYHHPTLAECEAAKAGISQKAIGDGYAICALNPYNKESKP